MENTEKRQLQNCLLFMRTGTGSQKRICLADRASRSCRNRPPGKYLLAEFLNGFFFGRHKEETSAVIALIDKIMERLAGVAGVITDKGCADTVICEFLEDFPGKPRTEDEEITAYGCLVQNYGGASGFVFYSSSKVQSTLHVCNQKFFFQNPCNVGSVLL